MEEYMSKKNDGYSIENILRNMDVNKLVGGNGISSNGLTSLVENIETQL